MRYFLVRVVVNTLALIITIQLLPGLQLYHSFSGFGWGDALLSYIALAIGFWASTARSAINSVFVVARKSYPTRFFARTTDALAFVLQNLGEDGVDVEALARQIDRLVDP